MAITVFRDNASGSDARPLARVVQLMMISAVMGMIGCDMPPRPPIERAPVSDAASVEPQEEVEIVEPPQDAFMGDWETWEVYRIAGRNVGYRHITAESQFDRDLIASGDTQVRYTLQDEVLFRKGHLRFVQSLSQTSLETPKGELRSFNADLRVGPMQTLMSGNSAGRLLAIETIRGTSRVSRTLPWASTTRGLLARYQSLRRNPMKKDETRKLRYLLPWRYELAIAELFCSGQSAIPMLDGQFQLLTEITCRIRVDDQIVAEHMIWTDDKGIVQKTLEPSTRLESYRTQKSVALAALGETSIRPDRSMEPEQAAPRHLFTATVDVQGQIERPDDASRVAFSVSIKPRSADPEQADPEQADESPVILPAPHQLVRQVEGGYQVLVSRDPENRDGFDAFTEQPSDEDLASTTVFNHQEPLVARMTAALADKPKKEAALESAKVVHGVLGWSDDGVIERASLIASRAGGGSIQHAILLTSMLRSLNIPARLAIGVKYESLQEPSDSSIENADRSDVAKASPSRMDIDYWTVAFVDGQWLALDATTGDIASPDRITLMTSHLGGANEYTDVGRAFEMLGRLDIQVLKAQY
ncbi:transglutaminase domain-containing protein [Stieleria varia]|uniref:transglutaminase domain-containing protein n=1 Tax=Stieleria varia TaxID=2528005 RepID=UPI001E422B07|nr:transglutaminase domain-containing protein [Stieleria varia]